MILLGLAEFDHADVVLEIAVDALKRIQTVFERGSLLHQALGLLRIAPKTCVFGHSIEFVQTLARFRYVKDASSAAQWTA